MQPGLMILKMESHDTKTFRVFEQVDLLEKEASQSRNVLTQQDFDDAKAFLRASLKNSDVQVVFRNSERIQKAATLAVNEAKVNDAKAKANEAKVNDAKAKANDAKAKANEAKAKDAKAKIEQRQRQAEEDQRKHEVERRKIHRKNTQI